MSRKKGREKYQRRSETKLDLVGSDKIRKEHDGTIRQR